MRCQDIMSRPVQSLVEAESIQSAARKMRDANVGLLPVIDAHGKAVGTLTDRDIALRLCAEDRSAVMTRVSDIMGHDVVACRPADDVTTATRLMAEHHKSRVLVTDPLGKLEGVISLSDIARRQIPGAAELLSDVVMREVLEASGARPITPA